MKAFLYFMFFTILLLEVSSCKKEYHLEEDPFYTGFRPLWKKLEFSHWQLKKILLDNQDYSYLIDNDSLNVIYEIEFKGMQVNKSGFVYAGYTLYKKRKNTEFIYTQFYNCFYNDDYSFFSGLISEDNYKNNFCKQFGPINYYGDCYRLLKLTNNELWIETYFNNQKAIHQFEKI